VNAVMNLRVPQNAGRFLNGFTTVWYCNQNTTPGVRDLFPSSGADSAGSDIQSMIRSDVQSPHIRRDEVPLSVNLSPFFLFTNYLMILLKVQWLLYVPLALTR
jgi:hypothetical protein